MSIREIITLECGCEKCQHVWRPRTDKPPEVCPKCKRRDWNFEKVEKEIERIENPKAATKTIQVNDEIFVEIESLVSEPETNELKYEPLEDVA